MAEKVQFLMLRYDTTSWPRKDCTQMLDVYVGSFSMLKYYPASRPRKELHKNIWDHFSTLKYDPPPPQP
jgi:hypothetical protein